jgi:translation initiation factor 2 subunit 1
MAYKEYDAVLCTVERVDRTTVFVKLETGEQGTIITSEVAPGRIRNLRDYVSPGRKIVCKILKIDSSGNIHLSLRRVFPKEKKEVMERHERERNSLGILKSVLGEQAENVSTAIKQESGSLQDFLNNCKTSPSQLEKYMPKESAEKICKILLEKKEKFVEVKKEFLLSSGKPNGIQLTKNVLSFCQGKCEISYLAAGKFTIKIKSTDYKKANSLISQSLEKIGTDAKEKKMDFHIKE